MAISLQDRKKILSYVPWVKEIHGLLDCEAKTTRNQPCKLFARWEFKSLSGEISHFCFQHLVYSGFDGALDESRRFERWWKRNKDRFLPPDDPDAVVEPPE